MIGTKDKIYLYFERDPRLRALFIINNDFIADELANSQWAKNYEFKSDRFTTKYNLNNKWRNKKKVKMIYGSTITFLSLQTSFQQWKSSPDK
jgi:hypothetical protein